MITKPGRADKFSVYTHNKWNCWSCILWKYSAPKLVFSTHGNQSYRPQVITHVLRSFFWLSIFINIQCSPSPHHFNAVMTQLYCLTWMPQPYGLNLVYLHNIVNKIFSLLEATLGSLSHTSLPCQRRKDQEVGVQRSVALGEVCSLASHLLDKKPRSWTVTCQSSRRY